jgi:hypothetical protein
MWLLTASTRIVWVQSNEDNGRVKTTHRFSPAPFRSALRLVQSSTTAPVFARRRTKQQEGPCLGNAEMVHLNLESSCTRLNGLWTLFEKSIWTCKCSRCQSLVQCRHKYSVAAAGMVAQWHGHFLPAGDRSPVPHPRGFQKSRAPGGLCLKKILRYPMKRCTTFQGAKFTARYPFHD